MSGRHGASHALRLAAIGALLIGVYTPGLDGAFQYDDLHSIVDNEHVRSLRNVPAFFTDPLTFSSVGHRGMFRPLVMISYAVDHAVGGGGPLAYKLTNLLLHWLAAAVLYRLVLAVGGGARTAFVGAALFAVHPINSETVSYVSARSESMAWVFGLGALLAYAAARQQRANPAWPAVLLGGSLLAKSVTAVTPALAAAFELSRPPQRRWGGAAAPLLLMGAAVATYLSFTRVHVAAALTGAPVRGLAEQLLTQAKALPYYLSLLTVPAHLSVEHAFRTSRGLVEAAPWLGAGLLVSIGWILLLGLRRGTAGACAAWCLAGLLTLLPTAIVPLNVLVNEHRLYALSGLAIVGLVTLAPRVRWRRPGTLVLVGVLAVLSGQRSQVWASSEALWQDALVKAPTMPRPHLFVGDEHLRAGRHEAALAAYERALAINPERLSDGDQLAIHNNRGAAHLRLGQHRAAIDAYEQALAIDPTYERSRVSVDALLALEGEAWHAGARSFHDRGLRLLVAGDLERARSLFRRALGLQLRPEILVALSMAEERAGNLEAAARTRTRLRILFPKSPFTRHAAGVDTP